MTAYFAAVFALALLAAFAAGLLSPDCSLAVTLACMRLRYAVSAAEAASAAGMILAAAFASTAGGAGLAMTSAGRAASAWAGRAAVSVIPAPEGLLDG